MFTKLLIAIFLAILYFSEGDCVLNNHKSSCEPKEGDVRLSNSSLPSEGRVEIYHHMQWGSVCDDNWDLSDAQVVCRQLNFQGAKAAVTWGHLGQAHGHIWLDDVECSGQEQQLVSCRSSNWGVHNCNHEEDAGVICDTQNYDSTQSDSIHSLDHSTTLSDDLGKIFDSGTTCDFLIAFQTSTGAKQEDGVPDETMTTICAHKAILMLYPYFNASVGENNITVTVNTTCQSYSTSIIRYLYTRQINVTYSSAMCLHQLASEFGLRKLLEDVGQVISKSLPNDASFYSQVSLYKYAVESKDFVLEENCVQYMAWNFQNLTSSPVWPELPVELLRSLLTRSDLVVADEYFLLQTLEDWITNNGGSLSSEKPADLLRLVRFPMIPAEKLYELETKSLLFSAHRDLYRDSVLKAYQFNVLLYSNLTQLKLVKEIDDYKPRIYTSNTWSIAIDSSKLSSSHQGLNQYNYHYYYGLYSNSIPLSSEKLLHTSLHSIVVCEDNKVTWAANIFKTSNECSREGVHCNSLPAARLTQQNNTLSRNISFDNRILLTCQNRYICQIQAFHSDMAHIDQALVYPCPDDNYIYTFVVRPEFV
ncbi:galectin-3-binding protein A-like [Xiphophorus maculatus]|uniref:Galectin-3-binding protein A-like n=1 Tax=Xiphophorus maculatus TaxID=8083 RepID=A0A3B5QIZ3_XIPMA|nr:galectin-3-binding protein A-like [Xiphophorus maculatus]